MLADLLLHGQGEDEFPRLGAGLDVVLEEGEVLEVVVFKDFVGELVQGQGHLLVLLVGEVVAGVEVALLLGRDDLLHHIDGGIVLAAVLGLALRHDDLVHGIGALNELDVYLLRAGLLDGDGVGVVAYHGKGQGALAGRDAILAVDVGDGQGLLVLGVKDADARHGVAVVLVDDGASDVLGCCLQGSKQQEHEYGYAMFQMLCF